MRKNKGKIKIIPSSSYLFSQPQLQSFICGVLYSPPISWTRKNWGMGSCGQYTLHLCYSFLPVLFPCIVPLLQHRSFPRAAVPRTAPARILQEKPSCASSGLCSGCCVGICPNKVSPTGCKRAPALMPRAPPPSFTRAGAHIAVSSLFFPLLLMLPCNVLPSLGNVFAEVPPAWLWGSVVS